jgi:hypothetical protein
MAPAPASAQAPVLTQQATRAAGIVAMATRVCRAAASAAVPPLHPHSRRHLPRAPAQEAGPRGPASALRCNVGAHNALTLLQQQPKASAWLLTCSSSSRLGQPIRRWWAGLCGEHLHSQPRNDLCGYGGRRGAGEELAVKQRRRRRCCRWRCRRCCRWRCRRCWRGALSLGGAHSQGGGHGGGAERRSACVCVSRACVRGGGAS